MGESLLSIRDLRVSFKTPNGIVQAVRGIDLDVQRGEMVGVVGESGSGKSVSFLGMLGLLPSSAMVSGSAVADGIQLVGATNKTMRTVRGRKVSMIFQDPLSALNPVYKIGTQIVEMLQTHQSIGRKAAWTKSVELLDLVGIPQPSTRAEQYPHEFSGGMRQRAMIAMALANDPDVLIADEPTTALDVTVQAQILEVFQRIQSELNTAVVMITHDLGVIARVADRVQVMYAGRVVERSAVEPLFAQPSHPYTSGLLSSLPHAGQERLQPILGSPPNMLQPPPGCGFAARCAYATPECSVALPDLRQRGDSQTACIRIDEINLAGVGS
jgi:oligopeptide/dipeptide ABC transporter ATP-binding protein